MSRSDAGDRRRPRSSSVQLPRPGSWAEGRGPPPARGRNRTELVELDQLRVGSVVAHRVDAVLRASLTFVSLAARDHFAIASLEPEAKLANLVRVQLELPSHRYASSRRLQARRP